MRRVITESVNLVTVDGDVADVVELQQTIELPWFGFRRERPCLCRERRTFEQRQRLGLHGDEAAFIRHDVQYGTYRHGLLSRPIDVVYLHVT